MEEGAYGAAASGLPFNPQQFFKRPQVILRIVSWLLALIVFSCISSSGYYEGMCLFNKSGACGYGVGIGVIAFLACIAFLVVDVMFDKMSNVKHRKFAVLGDLGFSGFWAFLWFVGFCYLTDQWRKSDFSPHGVSFKSSCQAAVAFCFFSIGTWVGLAVLAFLRYRQGAADAFAPAYEDQSANQPSAYPGAYPGEAGDPYQQPPFSGGGPEDAAPEYQPPTY